jgi:hypothetical protein
MFRFKYSQSSLLPNLTIVSASEKTSAKSTLPAGLESANYTILITGIVTDNYDISANASQSVIVLNNNSVSISSFSSSILSAFNDNGDTDALYLSVNSVASTINVQNCSSAPNCTALNRQPCLSLPNTCGSCFSGFIGVVGASNTKCTNTTLTPLAGLGGFCEVDSDCLYQECTDGTCTAPSLKCPTNLEGSDCSGNGFCAFEDSVGNPLFNCTILDVRRLVVAYA